MACTARQPVQWAGTRTRGPIAASASHTMGMVGSNPGPLRWNPPITA
jgi:hypothetical protein